MPEGFGCHRALRNDTREKPSARNGIQEVRGSIPCGPLKAQINLPRLRSQALTFTLPSLFPQHGAEFRAGMNCHFCSILPNISWQIRGRIGGKTLLLDHQWNKRAERNTCVCAGKFVGLCLVCAARQSGFDSRPGHAEKTIINPCAFRLPTMFPILL